MPKSITQLIYMDDSGEPKSGLVVLAWIEFEAGTWNRILEEWLDIRRQLRIKFEVSSLTELHTSQYVHGRGRISSKIPKLFQTGTQILWKEFGRAVAIECLKGLQFIEGLEVHSIYTYRDDASDSLAKERLYRHFTLYLSRELETNETLALVFIDGNGTDKIFQKVHRELSIKTRSIVEDSIHLESSNSQLIQIADLVAWCANAALDRNSNNEFAWGWYDTFLSVRDPDRKPKNLKS